MKAISRRDRLASGGSASLPVLAAEPDAPQALITRAEAIRIAVQANLSAKFTTATQAKKAEQGALVEYYAVPDQRPLWVDERGLTERGKAVMAEIEQADDYGLRAADYSLPNPAEFTASDAQAPPSGSPMPRSRSATPCSVTRATRAAAGSTPRDSPPISTPISLCPIRRR